jgi:fatty acid desaturase
MPAENATKTSPRRSTKEPSTKATAKPAKKKTTAKAKAAPAKTAAAKKPAPRKIAATASKSNGAAASKKNGTAKSTSDKSKRRSGKPSPFTLTPEQIEQFGEEMEALRMRNLEDLGQRDVDYIKKILDAQRRLELTGRGLQYLGFLPPVWLAATVSLGLAKIIDNMEIGHNVMHGQYDWTQDPRLSSKEFEWDTAAPSDNWKNSHNFTHHTYTNIVGKDRDVGYGILRMSDEQPWHPYYLGNLLWGFLLMTFFEYGVALHDIEVDRLFKGEITLEEQKDVIAKVRRKVGKQAVKDYLLFPALTGPLFPLTLASNFSANIIRNVWAFTIIFCGHFPDGIEDFSMEETEDETRGQWYYRQVLGSGNLTGGPLFHIMSGNLSHQIEHHLFPDIPAHRYADMSIEVREACARYGIPYNAGPLSVQFGTVVRKIARLSFPDNWPIPSIPVPRLPKVSVPLPSIPTPSVPSVRAPKVSVPTPSIPSVSMPSLNMPSVSLPKPSLSAIGIG